MTDQTRPLDKIIHSLQERAKELNCLYRIEEVLHRSDAPLEEILRSAIEVIPAGWQHAGSCQARIVYQDKSFHLPSLQETPWVQSSPIIIQEKNIGRVDVFYTALMPEADEGPFLKEERKLLDTIADRLSLAIQHRRLRAAFARTEKALSAGTGPSAADDFTAGEGAPRRREEWWVILDFLGMTDRRLLQHMTRKMANHLNYIGAEGARGLLHLAAGRGGASPGASEDNQPIARQEFGDVDMLTQETFRLAAEQLSEPSILTLIQKWIREDRMGFLATVLEVQDSTLSMISEAVERFGQTGIEESDLPLATRIGLRVSLIRRFFGDQVEFVRVAKNYLAVSDFAALCARTIMPGSSRGKLGGKSAGLILAAKIIEKSPEYAELLSGIKVPKTWYIPSDALLTFIHHNDLEDVYNWKYLEPDQIRQIYPHIVQVFKHSTFPTQAVQGLSLALDDLGDRPLIVRSSSLLEDSAGSAFSGKYKSLFLANRGEKQERLDALLDAIAEVYASVFGPDPIEYRAERDLLDKHEEMGIMIQEVVGTEVGRYFLPAFSGVAFSNNEFRWSPRINREDGLLRLVPGLGTRAVDRVGDDYPVLIAPGQPGLRASVTLDEIRRYSPARVDVIDLETRSFRTIEVRQLLREFGDRYPRLDLLVSVCDEDRVRPPSALGLDPEKEDVVFTFAGLATGTPFITQMRALLKLLSEAMGGPVDLEFASDGRDLYLVQCRPQSFGDESAPTPIPRDLPERKIVFTANRYISNGRIPDITHVVYVDPARYSELTDIESLREVGRAVGHLNRLLPKRQFILMGPGRWGSRGDIRLGVSVNYADINRTAALIEIARKKGNYLPDLSFGTHFFQDLVEGAIRYLPLYPDDPGVRFNEPFFRGSANILKDLLPEFAHFEDVLHVIDVPSVANGLVLRILMNADLQEAVGLLSTPGPPESSASSKTESSGRPGEDHWSWRLRLAQTIASQLDGARFGVRGFYVFGSTKNATAGPASDVDVIVHFTGTPEMRRSLEEWLEGWSLCLAEMNYLRTGYRTEGGLLDVHIVTDEDIAAQHSYAVKIGAVTDAARPLPLKGPSAASGG